MLLFAHCVQCRGGLYEQMAPGEGKLTSAGSKGDAYADEVLERDDA